MIASLLAALLLSAPTSAALPPPRAAVCLELTAAQLRERIEAYLNSIDVAIEADQWRALGPSAAPLLEQIASDAGALPTRRAKALWGLVHVSGPQASALLGQLATREDLPFAVRHAAVRGLGEVVSADRLEASLGPVMEQALDGRLRAAAAGQLVRKTAGGACAAVRARAAAEAAPVRSFYAAAIEGCESR